MSQHQRRRNTVNGSLSAAEESRFTFNYIQILNQVVEATTAIQKLVFLLLNFKHTL